MQKGKIRLIVVLACSLLFVGGCSKMKDVEDFDYVVAVSIAPSDDGYRYSFHISREKDVKMESVTTSSLKKAIRLYENTHEKSLHFGHCAAILFDNSMFQRKCLTPQTAQVLKDLILQNEITLQTNVYAVEGDITDFARENIPGQYLNDILHNNKREWEEQAAIYHLYQLLYHNIDCYDMVKVTIKDHKVVKLARESIMNNFSK